jgi:hypothetical protein
MNQPRNPRLLAALALAAAALGIAATWALWDLSRDLAAAPASAESST